MSVLVEIKALEDALVQAELGPDPDFFEAILADDLVMVADGATHYAKSQIVEAHRPGNGPKFTRVQMHDLKIVDHENGAVVTGEGEYEGPQGTQRLKFMRVWVRKNIGWQIVAGTILA
jgi:hypothetical protein